MIGNGIGFILHENGYSCSNQVFMDVDKERVEINGEKKSKQIIKLNFNCIFDGVGNLAVDLPVYCLYKDEEKGEQKAFTGIVSRMIKDKVTVLIQTTSEKQQEIKQKIKSWQHKQMS